MRVRFRTPASARTQAGFTLAEIAVTIIIVGITLLWILEGLNNAKMTAAHTHHMKIASELAMQTLAEIESGLYWEDIDEDGLTGTYAEEGYETFAWEVVLGDESFPDLDPDDSRTLEHDTWAYQRELEEQQAFEDGDDDEDEDDVEEPYEKVKIRVQFPQTTQQKPEIILERWIPWAQVYGQSDEDIEAEDTDTEP
ncbi:MAG: prepilin-type N-terminal cleavage/methylation domain-containing protein [Planctomycetota bacterium]